MDKKPKPSMRLKDFDYRSAETYFVTICLRTRSDLFGDVSNRGVLMQSPVGNMVAITLMSIPDAFDGVSLDDFVVMPDHVHALIGLEASDAQLIRPSLGEVIGRFKGITTHRYGKGVERLGWPRYEETF